MTDLNTLSMSVSDMLLPWLAVLISVVVTIWFKDFATNLAKGIQFIRNSAFMPGDVVYLDGEEATIISIGVRQTVFALDRDGQRVWRYIPNSRIDFVKLEKIIRE